MGFDTAYEAITEQSDDHRWAFGTGFASPLAGVDPAVADDVDGMDLAAYCLMLGDDALIMSHRLQQWLTRAPELEEETALANIALDLLGQARLLLTRAGQADGTGRGEDAFAFGRDVHEFGNVRLVELADADFGALLARLLVFSTWRLALLARLRDSRDPVLAAIADKGVKELTYHRDYAARWVVRLGDGTDYSHARVAAGFAAVAPLVDELFRGTDLERRLAAAGVGVDPADVRAEVESVLADVLGTATLTWPEVRESVDRDERSGRDGVHTEALGPLLGELHGVARALPGASW
jgi:ring-1,2-phenylacetyl-CoA epoxidase subunit PaaC